MLTLFACPKAFRGHIDTIQRNAILSWIAIDPRPEIILMGSDEGVAEIALEFGLKHIPQVKCSNFGTPLVSSLFETAQLIGKGSLFVYTNSDILLPKEFSQKINQVPFDRFMLSGQRWNLDVVEPLEELGEDWQTLLLERIKISGKLEGVQAMDYFVFPRGTYTQLPEFAIGRPGWDNWMLYHALKTGMVVVDATNSITAIHQNHDYHHHPSGKKGVYEGTEAKQNLKLAGGRNYAYFMLDLANWRLEAEGIQQPQWNSALLRRHMDMLPFVYPEFRSWAALLWHFVDNRVFGEVDELRFEKFCQTLGNAFFGYKDTWFRFSTLSDEIGSDTYLPTPEQNEQIIRLNHALEITQSALQAKQAEVENLHSRIERIESSKLWKLWCRLKSMRQLFFKN